VKLSLSRRIQKEDAVRYHEVKVGVSGEVRREPLSEGNRSYFWFSHPRLTSFPALPVENSGNDYPPRRLEKEALIGQAQSNLPRK
jgi:hypothetical protein